MTDSLSHRWLLSHPRFALVESLCQYSKRQKARGQKDYYWYVVVSVDKSVLTFLATATWERHIIQRLTKFFEKYNIIMYCGN